MSLFGAIRCTAFRVLQPTNKIVLPTIGSNRLLANQFEKLSEDIKNLFPARPKRPQSGYNLFFKELSTKLRTENPNLKIQELAKAVGEQWKSLDPVHRQQLQDQNKKERDDYKKQIEEWKESLNDKQKENYLISLKSRKQVLARRRLKSELKRLEYPVRNLGSFNHFLSQSVKNRVKTDEPYREVFKKIAIKWKSLSKEEKEPYVQLAMADKARYLKELEEWKKNVLNNADDEMQKTLDKLAKLKTISSKSYLLPDKDKEKEKTQKKKKKTTKPKKIAKKSTKPKRSKGTKKKTTNPKKSEKSKKSASEKSISESSESEDN